MVCASEEVGLLMGYPMFDLSKVKTCSLRDKQLKVSQSNLIYPGDVQIIPSVGRGSSSPEFDELYKLAEMIADPTCPVVLGLGGATVKTGLSPLIVSLLQKRLI